MLNLHANDIYKEININSKKDANNVNFNTGLILISGMIDSSFHKNILSEKIYSKKINYK